MHLRRDAAQKGNWGVSRRQKHHYSIFFYHVSYISISPLISGHGFLLPIKEHILDNIKLPRTPACTPEGPLVILMLTEPMGIPAFASDRAHRILKPDVIPEYKSLCTHHYGICSFHFITEVNRGFNSSFEEVAASTSSFQNTVTSVYHSKTDNHSRL